MPSAGVSSLPVSMRSQTPGHSRLWRSLSAALALSGAACGPTELPAFATPPPYDAGLSHDRDAAAHDDDAGPRASR